MIQHLPAVLIIVGPACRLGHLSIVCRGGRCLGDLADIWKTDLEKKSDDFSSAAGPVSDQCAGESTPTPEPQSYCPHREQQPGRPHQRLPQLH
jgi:hypothetical protein